MIDPNSYRDFLLRNLRGSRVVSGGTEVLARCLSCPDSSNPNNAHMYFKIPQTENDLLYFNCVKCHYSGCVTHNKLLEWGIFDSDMAIKISSHNNSPSIVRTLAKEFTIYNLNPPPIYNDQTSLSKLAYINNRLGTSLSLQEAVDNKIILNLGDLLNGNNISEYTRAPSILKQLDEHFVGFLSYDNAFVNLRKSDDEVVYDTISKRYVNYNIFNKIDNSRKFYVLPTSVMTNSLDPVKLYIAEGPMDILSIKYNLVKPGPNKIFAAVTGSGFKGLLRFIITNMKFINLEIHLYRDGDMDWSTIEDIAEYLKIFRYSLYIHSNTYPGKKDMGVRSDEIIDTITKIL